MNRRSMVVSAGAFLLAKGLRAQCGIPSPTGPYCQVQLPIAEIVVDAQYQQCVEWCWAASIATIFAFHGHPIDQRQVVLRTYGSLGCFPATSNAIVARALSGNYVDANNVPFTATITGAFDGQLRESTLDNGAIIDEIQNGRPVLVCNTHHAMVLSLVDYRPGSVGPQLVNWGVIDPWPYSPRVHNLTQPEMIAAPLGGQLMFMASVVTT